MLFSHYFFTSLYSKNIFLWKFWHESTITMKTKSEKLQIYYEGNKIYPWGPYSKQWVMVASTGLGQGFCMSCQYNMRKSINTHPSKTQPLTTLHQIKTITMITDVVFTGFHIIRIRLKSNNPSFFSLALANLPCHKKINKTHTHLLPNSENPLRTS